MKRRAFLTIAGLGSVAFFVPNRLLAGPQSILANGNKVSLECLGDKPGARFLDGRTANGTVGLVPQIKTKTFSGTQWLVHMNSRTQQVFLECRGTVEGPRFLDGRTADGTVGLAPNTKKLSQGPYGKPSTLEITPTTSNALEISRVRDFWMAERPAVQLASRRIQIHPLPAQGGG